MLGNIFQQGYMIADAIIVGRGVGVYALASLGASDWINWMFLWAVQGLAHGFSVRVAQVYGAGDVRQLKKTVAMIVWLALLFGLLLMGIGLLSIRPLLTLLHTEAAIFPGAERYLRVLFAGTPAVLAYNMAAAILRCMGNSRTPLAAVAMAACINIGLDLLFVMGFGWGIFGAAFATVLAQLGAFLYCLFIMGRMPLLRLSVSDWKPDRVTVLALCRLGIPAALQNSIIAIGGMVVQSVLNGFGFVFVAGFTATNKLYGVLESTAISLGYAMTAYMGQNRGAGKAMRIDAGMRAVICLSLLFSTAITLAMTLFGRPLLGWFVSKEEASAGRVIEIAYQYLLIMSALLIFLFFIHAYRSTLQGLGNICIPALSGVIELVMRIGAALLLPPLLGERGIFFAEVAAWCGASLFMMAYYYLRIEKIKQEIHSERELNEEPALSNTTTGKEQRSE